MLVAQGQSVGDRLGRGQRLQGGRAVQAEALGQLSGIYDKGAQLEFSVVLTSFTSILICIEARVIHNLNSSQAWKTVLWEEVSLMLGTETGGAPVLQTRQQAHPHLLPISRGPAATPRSVAPLPEPSPAVPSSCSCITPHPSTLLPPAQNLSRQASVSPAHVKVTSGHRQTWHSLPASAQITPGSWVLNLPRPCPVCDLDPRRAHRTVLFA